MNKTNPVYYIVIFFSMFITMIAFLFIFVGMNWSFLVMIILALSFIIGVIFLAFKLSDGTLEQRGKILSQCVECNREIDANSTYCKHCGSPQKDHVICDYCGTKNKSDNIQCIECNALLK